MKKEKLLELLPKILSYVLVAVLTATGTLAVVIANISAFGGGSKLDVLENLILDKFIGTADKTAIEDAAADAMVNALGDRWSYYIPAKEYAKYQEQKKNSYVGIGITIQQRSDGAGLDIVEVVPGTSAEEVGLQAGDILLAVEGQKVQDLTMEQVKNMIRGEEGSQVEIRVLCDGEELDLTVTRCQVPTIVAKGQMLEGNIGIVRIVNFNDNCAKETIAIIEGLVAQGAEKLIFDVRNNPGGYVSELVAVLDYLLPEGVLFQSEDYAGEKDVQYSEASCLNLPMAVLVNGNSYSAAEFFAATLWEYEAGLVVGEQTSGKGYFQYTFELPDGSAVGLSTGKYYTSKGASLTDVGVTLDVLVPVDAQTAAAIRGGTLEYAKDPQVQAAVNALKLHK